MAEEKEMKSSAGEEKEIDLLDLARQLWQQRRKLLIWSGCAAILGLIIAFSIPREYTTSVKLAPEVNGNKTATGSLSALASMAGLSAGSGNSTDAVYPMLYPDVLGSVPFMTGLFDVEVSTLPKKDEKSRLISVRQYMEEDTKSPWWSAIMKLPFKLIALLKSDEEGDPNHKLNPFQLTKEENNLVLALKDRVTASVDQKTSVVTVNVTMQDALISAELCDTVVSRLQGYITEYRTNKARKDLAYAEKLNAEAKENYYKAQQRYADYLDHNQGVILRSAQTTRERLENEATLAFILYNQTAQQVQQAQAKVQETTPVYAVITPATVPVKPSAPRKIMILAVFIFLGFVACAAKILFLDPLLQKK